jgi:pimeloyl-ACP methyl ester carboxylesterase
MNLLLLPGLLCDRAVWAPVLPRVAALADCTVAEYADETTLGAMAQRVLAYAPPTFAVAGHSMGGRVALEILRRAPGRVERLALLDTGCRARPAGAAGDDERAGRLALLAVAREQGMRAMARAWVQPMVHPARRADAALIDAVLDMFERRTPVQFAGQIEALLTRPDATAVLAKCACPVLVLAGREDALSTPQHNAEMAALVPGSRLEILERCGHMAPMERPDETGEALVQWLQVTAGRGPDAPGGARANASDPHDRIA